MNDLTVTISKIFESDQDSKITDLKTFLSDANANCDFLKPAREVPIEQNALQPQLGINFFIFSTRNSFAEFIKSLKLTQIYDSFKSVYF